MESWTHQAVKEQVDDQHRLAATDADTLRAALSVLRPGQKSNTDRRLRKAIKTELEARQNPKPPPSLDENSDTESEPSRRLWC
jgi:hypothetical protein